MFMNYFDGPSDRADRPQNYFDTPADRIDPP